MTRILALLREKRSKAYWRMYGTHFLVLGGPIQGLIIFFIIGSYIRLMKTRALHIFRHDYLMCLLWTQNFRFQFPESKQMILQEM